MPIKHLVISGGGPNILQLYGGLKYSHIKHVWCIDDIESIYATSAGSIVGLLLLLKIPFDDIDNYLINRPWDTIFNISGHSLLQLLKQTGIFNINSITEFLDPLLKSKQCNSTLTLKQLYDITKVNFVVFTSCLNDFEYVSISHSTHPDMRVVEAIYSSISIPCLFEPLSYENKYYFDGGLFSNYPLDKRIESLKVESENNVIDTDEIMGVCGNKSNSDEIVDTTIKPMSNIFEYFFEFIKKIINKFDNSYKINIKYELKLNFAPFTISVWNELINSKDIREQNIQLPIEKIDTLLNDVWKNTD